MLLPTTGVGMNYAMDDMNLIQQAQRHHLVVREIDEEIDEEIGLGEDGPSFGNTTVIGAPLRESFAEDHDSTGEKKEKVIKSWREEWADTYKWAYVDVKDGTPRIFCYVGREFGWKCRRIPYGNEGSRNMQMSALKEHKNSLLNKEAYRLQSASKYKITSVKPVYIKAVMSKTVGSILKATLKRDPHEDEFIQAVHEIIDAGGKEIRFTWLRGDDLCDSYEQHQSGVDGNGLFVESGCAWRKVNLQHILEESTKNHVKMRSHEAERNLKSHNLPEENHNLTPAHDEFHDQTFAAQGLHDQTFAPQRGFDYSEGRAGSSSASGSDSDSESNSSDSGSDSGSYSSSRSRSPDGSWSGSSGDSESDASSSSEGLEGTDEDVDILNDDEKEPKHQAEACDQRMSLPIPVKSLDGKSTQNEVDEKQDDNKSDAVDIEKDSSEEREAKMALTTNTISDRVRKYAEETKPFSYDYQQIQGRKDYIGSLFDERESEVKDRSRNEQSDSFDKLSTGKHKRDSELKNIGEKSEGTKRLKGGNLDS